MLSAASLGSFDMSGATVLTWSTPRKDRDVFYGTLVARLGAARSVSHVHVKPGDLMRLVVRRSMGLADAVVGVSQFVIDSIVDLGHESDKVHTVHNGLEARQLARPELVDAGRGSSHGFQSLPTLRSWSLRQDCSTGRVST